MPDVVFNCTCPKSVGEARIFKVDPETNEQEEEPVAVLTFEESGSETVVLDDGKYRVRIRANGVKNTKFTLEVTEGATMEPFETKLPEGAAAGRRTAHVPEKEPAGGDES